jgi:cytochrome c-type biogenesis protein CcmE
MTRKQKRLAVIAGGFTVVSLAVVLVLVALRDEIVFFVSPSDVMAREIEPGTRMRLGGLVADGSVERGAGTQVLFAIEDGSNKVEVRYDGILPDLFREGQGVITEGSFPDGGPVFVADTVLARHDENYMPREVADSLKAQGVWQGDEAAD